MDQLFDSLINAFIELIESGEAIPDDLVNEMTNLLIDRMEGMGANRPPDLNAAPYPSSNINAFKYDPKSQKLWVKFMGKDVADAGPVYSYEGVPSFIFDIFSRGAVGPKTSGSNKWHTWKKGVTPSHGAAMAALVKAGGYPYQRLS